MYTLLKYFTRQVSQNSMKIIALLTLWILSLLWWYFSWKYLNIQNFDSLVIVILLSWMFVLWVLFGKVSLFSEKKSRTNPTKTKVASQLEQYSNKKTKEQNSNNFSDFEDIQDNTFLNISNNIKRQKKESLQTIEGIGPKIEELLNKWWIYSYNDLELSDISVIQTILKNAWSRYVMHNPSTWKKQAALANNWNFWELEKYQDSLVKWVEV